MIFPNPQRDPSGVTYLKQVALKQLGFYDGIPDNWYGPKTEDAMAKFRTETYHPDIAASDVKRGTASSFADPADVAAFKKCILRGGSEQQCLKVGDNGIGAWGDDTSKGSGPSCALPPEVLEKRFGDLRHARNKPVLVMANGRQVICLIRDRMPHEANIENGAMIDLNPDAVEALHLSPPIMVPASYQFV